MRRFLRYRRRRTDDEGIALVAVVLGMAVVTTLALTGLAAAVQTVHFSRHDQDWNAALAAAQAGLDDYVFHLNQNDDYATSVATSWTSKWCDNAALKGPHVPIPNACGWTATTPEGFTLVDSGNSNGAAFHYDVDASGLASTGTIRVVSTGKVNGVTRQVEAAIGRGGSTDFVYYTDHEDADPDNVVMYPAKYYGGQGGAPTECTQYWYSGRQAYNNSAYPAPPNDTTPYPGHQPRDCQEITFIGGDVIDGPVHTNDAALMTDSNGIKPEFKPEVNRGFETSYPGCKNATSNPNTWKYCDRTQNGANYDGKAPHYADPLLLQDNSASFATAPGCKYVGETRIKLNSNGTMTVWSHDSNTTSACGGSSPMGVTVSVPDGQTVYVSDSTVAQHRCVAGEIGDGLPLGSGYTGAAASATSPSFTYDDYMWNDPKLNCGLGNLYIEGTLKGKLTVASENNVVITGDITLASGINGSDKMGIVATNSIEVMHPYLDKFVSYCTGTTWVRNGWSWSQQCTGYDWKIQSQSESNSWPHRAHPGSSGYLEIDASLQALNHSFLVQNYDQGSAQGKLSVRGSIAQKYRGTVGAGSGPGMSGYLKDYIYDSRLVFSSPPYFPQWVNAVWTVRQFGEVN